MKDLFCLDSCCGYITLANHQTVSKSTLTADTTEQDDSCEDAVNNGSPLLKGKYYSWIFIRGAFYKF